MPQTQYNLHLKGFVGGADFDRNYVDYILAKNAGKEVNVLIDSLGGNLATALSIAAAFKNHGKVSVHFVGMNASAATIASLGAAHISIDKNAMYLVHKCSTAFFEWGSLNADQFRPLSPTAKRLPAVSILGSLAGSLAVAMLAGGHSPAEWLAVGSGMGYYSISSVLITGYRGTELGTIALLSNIVREMIALLGAALLVRLFGTLAPIAAAGATAMDTTLPVISRTCGPRLVPVSIYCGMATDFSVPFLVTLFCSM